LLKKVKTNTNLIKNINLNNEPNIKDQYIGELIDRGKEISTMIISYLKLRKLIN
jgi:hypothetical protein